MRLVEYDERWPILFGAESVRILAAIPELPLTLEHIGSTAVPGLCAKPVLDILAGHPASVAVLRYVAPFEGAGYQHRGMRASQVISSFGAVSPGLITFIWLSWGARYGASTWPFATICGQTVKRRLTTRRSSALWRRASLETVRRTLLARAVSSSRRSDIRSGQPNKRLKLAARVD